MKGFWREGALTRQSSQGRASAEKDDRCEREEDQALMAYAPRLTTIHAVSEQYKMKAGSATSIIDCAVEVLKAKQRRWDRRKE